MPSFVPLKEMGSQVRGGYSELKQQHLFLRILLRYFNSFGVAGC